jgi:hypothetical protein
MSDKFARDVCEKEFERLCVAYHVDTAVETMTKEELASFEEHKAKIMRLLAQGSLVVGQAPASLPVYTPVIPSSDPAKPHKPITFYPATGATLMAQDGFGPHDNVGRSVAVATELTKSDPGALSRLHVKDFRAIDAITNFFFIR